MDFDAEEDRGFSVETALSLEGVPPREVGSLTTGSTGRITFCMFLMPTMEIQRIALLLKCAGEDSHSSSSKIRRAGKQENGWP